MKLKSKLKWMLVALVFVLSWVGLVTFPMLGFQLGFTTAMVSLIMLMASVGYGMVGMIDANVFERLLEWLKTDDV